MSTKNDAQTNLNRPSAPEMYYTVGQLGDVENELDGWPVLISAGVAWRNPNSRSFNAHIPDAGKLMVDSGGFQAATKWDCAYPYTPQELHEWAESIDADTVAGMDVACEKGTALLESGAIQWGLSKTWQERMILSRRFQRYQRDHYEANDYDHDFMPVIQGHNVEDYERFIEWMREDGLDQYDTLGVGTVCKRAGRDEILEVARLVRREFPHKKIHLFGASLTIYKDDRFRGLFDSSDTAAWNWGASDKEELIEFLVEYREKVERYRAALGNGQLTF